MANPVLPSRPQGPPAASPHDVFPGPSEMAALMRRVDWAGTTVGPVDQWPPSLRTAVGISLESRFPILIWWGAELAMLYNDAYRPMLGDKHPAALGRPGAECWAEIWDVIGPMLSSVLDRGEATWSEDQLLVMNRRGFVEDTYFTFSYSPIRDETGGVGGVFTAVSETTERVVRERRLATLRRLAIDARTPAEATRRAIAVLEGARADVPVAAFVGADGTFVGTPGILAVSPAFDGLSALSGRAVRVADLERAGLAVTAPVGAQTPAMVAMIERIGQARPHGVLVLGASPRQAFDREYEDFLRLTVTHVATVIATADAFEEERRRAQALAELDRAKTLFFTNISHEFRTPLTLLLGPLERLAGSPALEDDDRREVEVAARNAARLLRLVNTLLEFSRIEAGRVEARYEPTDLAALTGDVASTFRSAFEKAGVALRVEAGPIEAPVYVDREHWERIVLNLLSNAFKFTFDGEVVVRVEQRGDDVALVVRDTGDGIAAEELPRLFERFHRVATARARTHEGTGIGLALVAELVRLHGGVVTASSEIGTGTTITVTIPVGAAHLPSERVVHDGSELRASPAREPFAAEAASWVGAVPEPTGLPGRSETARARDNAPRVVVADDNADMRDYLGRVLGDRFRLEFAADGADALGRVRRDPPDMVLSDVMMPGLDGFELLARIREDPRLRTLPVILLSARAGEEAEREALDAGADDYLVKPFVARDLAARVAAHASTARIRAAAVNDLRASEARWRVLVERNPHFVALVDRAGTVTYLNPAWRTFLGDGDAAGARVVERLHPDDRDRIRRQWRLAVRDAEPFDETVRVRRRDGEYRWVTVLAAPVMSEDGAIDTWISVGSDVHDRRTAEEALAASVRRLEENERELRAALAAKDEFLGMVSHELRTPLTTILGHARRLVGGEVSVREESAREAIRDMYGEAERLNRVIENLLVLARVDAGQRAEPEPLLVNRVVQAIVDHQRRQEPSRTYTVAQPDGLLSVEADAGYVEQILTNLLSNATKYSPPDRPITILIALAAGSGVTVSVEDEGVGLDPEEIDRLFRPFYRSPRTETQPGMGIGLAVCQRLAEATGGRLRAERRSGGGARFTLWLPSVQIEDEATGTG